MQASFTEEALDVKVTFEDFLLNVIKWYNTDQALLL